MRWSQAVWFPISAPNNFLMGPHSSAVIILLNTKVESSLSAVTKFSKPLFALQCLLSERCSVNICLVNDCFKLVRYCGDREQATPRCAQWYADDFALKASLASGSRKTSPLHPLINYIEKFGWRALPIWEYQGNFFDISIEQGKRQFTKRLLFLSSCSDPLKPQGTLPDP